jgi:hypothetical protein
MYLTDRLETAEAMVGGLKDLNIGDEAYRIVSKDTDGVRRHHLHDAGVLEQTDLLHSGERGALIGGALGLAFALSMVFVQPFGVPLSFGAFLATLALFGFFGAWTGGMVGVSHDNYKLAPFHAAIEEGKYLMTIGVRDGIKATAVKQFMHSRYPAARFVADDDTFTDPFTAKAEFRVRHIH